MKPHMILLDLAMPGMDGFEARRRLHDGSGDIGAYLVAMTGFGNEEDKRRTRAAGFDAHLTKPVELDALVALLNEARARAGKPAVDPRA
jgi:CheY-like chemotaxis protein